MKPLLSEATVEKIMQHLLERFGDPIGGAQGDGQGVPAKGGKKKDMGNRGFGAKLAEAGSPASCDQCGGMMGMDEAETCTQCGAMAPHVGGVLEVPPAKPAVGMVAVTVKGGPGANKGGGGRFAQGLTVKDMDGIPASGSGRGTQSAPKAAAAPASPTTPKLPAPMPAELELDEDETESHEDAQERLHFDIDHDGEIGEPKAHADKVLKGNAAELDEDDMPSAGSSPPPSGGSSPAPAPKPPPTPPSSSGGSSPPPSGGSSPPPSSTDEAEEMDEDMDLADLDEKAPPGREKQVKALKKKKGVDNPFAVAWASYNKSHGK